MSLSQKETITTTWLKGSQTRNCQFSMTILWPIHLSHAGMKLHVNYQHKCHIMAPQCWQSVFLLLSVVCCTRDFTEMAAFGH